MDVLIPAADEEVCEAGGRGAAAGYETVVVGGEGGMGESGGYDVH